MKRLSAWRDWLDRLEAELTLAEHEGITIIITPPLAPTVQQQPKAERVQVLLGELEQRERAMTAAYNPGDRDSYIKIRNLRAGINMRRERYGLPCLHFGRLPRPSHHARKSA